MIRDCRTYFNTRAMATVCVGSHSRHNHQPKNGPNCSTAPSTSPFSRKLKSTWHVLAKENYIDSTALHSTAVSKRLASESQLRLFVKKGAIRRRSGGLGRQNGRLAES